VNEGSEGSASEEYRWFDDLAGADLQVWWFTASHGNLCLLASGLTKGYAEVYFSFVRFLDCPSRMHGISIRIATEQETSKIKQLLPSDERDLLNKENLFIIESQEGTHTIWAMGAGLEWTESVNHEYIDKVLSSTLWENGPSIREL
jgi:hypothetical protein